MPVAIMDALKGKQAKTVDQSVDTASNFSTLPTRKSVTRRRK